MTVMDYVLGGILILAALFLIFAVLMQSSKSRRLSGTIAGGAETFFGKAKASTMEKKLATATTIVAIVFAILVMVVYLAQDTVDYTTQLPVDTTVAADAGTTDPATDAVTDPVTEPATVEETDPVTEPEDDEK